MIKKTKSPFRLKDDRCFWILQSTSSNQANLSRKIWIFLTGLQAALIFQANLLRNAFLSFSFTVDTFIWRLKKFLLRVLFSRHLLHHSFSFPYKEVEGTSRWFLQLFSFTKSITEKFPQSISRDLFQSFERSSSF